MPTENQDWILELDSDEDVDLFFESESDLGLEMDRPLIRGTDDYNELRNKPSINDIELSGNKSIEEILNGQWLLINGMTSEERIGVDDD